jgi:hypothetical protein
LEKSKIVVVIGVLGEEEGIGNRVSRGMRIKDRVIRGVGIEDQVSMGVQIMNEKKQDKVT